MAVRAERASTRGASVGALRRLGSFARWILAPLGATAAVVAAVRGWQSGDADGLALAGLSAVWGVGGAVLLLRQGNTRLGLLAVWFSLLSGTASLDTPTLAPALAVALLPPAAVHILLALPSGVLATRAAVGMVGTAYLVAAGLGVVLWAEPGSAPDWPIAVEAVVAAAVGVRGATARFRGVHGRERAAMYFVAAGIAAALEIALLALTLHVLVGWPPRLLQIAAAATVPIPLALLLWRSKRLERPAKRLVAPAISVAGLTALVVAIYVAVVLGLGRTPTDDERTLLVLSIVAAGISAVLYAPARTRLVDFSNRLVHGDRRSPEELVRRFSALSRAIPLDELLLQLAESLRSALALEAAEVWTVTGGALERVVSEPDRGPASIRLAAAEAAVIARTGICGRARIAVWLPQLLADRGDVLVRVAPLAHAGELFGLIVVVRAADGEPFDEEAERVLAELSAQVGLALRNVQLDSELRASLDELRRQAVELRASRARVVAAADAERRRIERDLHDGAQQYLVGVAANLGAVRRLTDSDPEQAKRVLDELQDSIEAAMQAFRDLAHGIYPPLLEDRGLAEALANAARHAAIPTRVEAEAVRRYDPAVEATVYFCCLESLQNAAKHAGAAARATVRLWEQEGGLLFDVSDDGCGLDPARQAVGSGLTNMRDRLEAVGGSLRVESTAGRGTRVVGTIPLGR